MLEQASKFKGILQAVAVPAIILAVVLSVPLLVKIFNLPPQEKIFEILKQYLEHYGYWMVFVSALVEGVFILGNYYPGSFVISLTVISAGRDVNKVIILVSLVSLAFFIAYYLNYLMGKYGWYKLFLKFGLQNELDNSKLLLSRFGLPFFLLSYWNPNFASFSATSAGTLSFSQKKFLSYSLVSVLFWNIIWGAVVFQFGQKALEFMKAKFIIPILLTWILVAFVLKLLKKESKKFL